jgi:hypothetical protein
MNWNEWIVKNKRLIYYLAVKYGGVDRAEDVAQEIVVRVLEAQSNYDSSKSAPSTWVGYIARSCIDTMSLRDYKKGGNSKTNRYLLAGFKRSDMSFSSLDSLSFIHDKTPGETVDPIEVIALKQALENATPYKLITSGACTFPQIASKLKVSKQNVHQQFAKGEVHFNTYVESKMSNEPKPVFSVQVGPANFVYGGTYPKLDPRFKTGYLILLVDNKGNSKVWKDNREIVK